MIIKTKEVSVRSAKELNNYIEEIINDMKSCGVTEITSVNATPVKNEMEICPFTQFAIICIGK